MSTPYKARRKQLGLDRPAEQTPYEKLQAALLKSGAARLAVIAGPNKSGPAGSELEFWNVPTPKPGRLVIVQKWTGKHVYGGWDAYIQINEHNTDLAIMEVTGRVNNNSESWAEAAAHLGNKLKIQKQNNAKLISDLVDAKKMINNLANSLRAIIPIADGAVDYQDEIDNARSALSAVESLDRRVEDRRKENTTHGQIRQALELGITESRRTQDRRKPT